MSLRESVHFLTGTDRMIVQNVLPFNLSLQPGSSLESLSQTTVSISVKKFFFRAFRIPLLYLSSTEFLLHTHIPYKLTALGVVNISFN